MSALRPPRSRFFAALTLLPLVAGGCYDGVGNQMQTDSGETSGSSGRDTEPTDPGSSGDTSGSGGENEAEAPPQALHRLNRLEYDNTVRDLLGTTLRPSESFGPDAEANGFDNQAEQLLISSSLIDSYDVAAREVIDATLNAVPVFSALFEGEALTVPGGYAVGSLWALSGNPLSITVTVPEAMDAQLALTAGAGVVGPAPAPQALLRIDGIDQPGFTVEGSAATRAVRTDPVFLEAGEHTVELVPTNHINDAAANNSNNIFVESLQVRSAEIEAPAGRALVYVCEPVADTDVTCYEQIVGNFATRAWRRPVRQDELWNLMLLWADVVAAGETAEQGLRLVMRAVMLSPRFFARMRTDQDDDNTQGGGWLDDYVLASRLSYFLWSSMPDARLFEMAAEGRLASDEGLSEAVDFMLEDPKAQALLEGFAEQWLSTRHLAAYVPSPDAYPGFDDPLRAAMTEESKAFFGDFLSNDAPLRDLLDPNFAFRNDRLASHYGLPPVGTDAMTRVPAGPGERRGLLTLAAWMTATSGPDHSSPIRRGQWVTDRVMCTSPPPPPPGVEFEPPEFGEDETVREALERHRDDPGCASCHVLLDIVGIGFEEYDGVAAPVLSPNIDNLGELPDGTTFEGAEALAELYADDPRFLACVTSKLFTYALGRPPDDDFDEVPLQELVQDASESAYDLRQLIDGLVHTPSFRSPAPL